MYKYFFLLFFLVSCGGTKEMVFTAPPIEERMLDTLVVSASPIVEEEKVELPQELPAYNPSHTRKMDLIHTDLDIKFDWEKQHVIGSAELTLSPIFYPQSLVVLDAKGFDIKSIRLGDKETEYDYDKMNLVIELDREYKKGEKVVLTIDYIAKPNEGPEGGSAAISSDKGLFFINPLGKEEKPMQIWTQGETENNSRWFPTIDKPNERTTQEISMTVEDIYETLSNGKLISSTKNSDGTRTDTWKQELPHAPYLFMIAVGDFAVVKDKWRETDLMYYVEKDYEPSAKEIFNHTPEMIEFFSSKLKYPYPWDKYAQVVTRDYVSGAMENTGAVIYGEFVQKTKRELIDNDNDYIVAHELFHHWFGDLVTVESWANLTLQEGFANYSEYLWFEHKYGRDRAENHRLTEMGGYLASVENQGSHPLIHYGYGDKEEMFDAHSYNKGGLVLHMLRSHVGDAAFFASLNKYLRDNEFTAVEVDELRMAFEDVTGMDLNWFFDQWYHAAGHPVLKVEYQYDSLTRTETILVDQIQDAENNLPIYRLEVEVAVYDQNGKVTYYPTTIDTRKLELAIEGIDAPAAVVLDGRNTQLAIIRENRTGQENMAIFKYSENYIDKKNAADALSGSKYFGEIKDQLLKEDYYSFRQMGVKGIKPLSDPKNIDMLKSLALNDSHSAVRNAALSKMATYDYEMTKPMLIDALEGEDAFSLVATAFNAIGKNEPSAALVYAKDYEDKKSPAIMSAIAEIYAVSGNGDHLPFFEDRLRSVSLFSMFNFYNKYNDLLEGQSPERKLEAVELLSEISMNSSNMFRRFVAASAINNIEDFFVSQSDTVNQIRVRNTLDKLIEHETNEQLLSRYRSF